jgi:hypothetical protein
MLDNFSERARQIVFAAGFTAGERGTNMIDTDDFLVGLVLEDQGMLENTIFSMFFEGQGSSVNRAEFYIPFFSPKVAEDVLAYLKEHLPQSLPVALTTEVPYHLPSNAYSTQRKPFRPGFNTARSNLCISWRPSLQKRRAEA